MYGENNKYNNYGSTYETWENSYETDRKPKIIVLKNKRLFNLIKQQLLEGDVIATLNVNKTTIYILSIKDEKKQGKKIAGFNAVTHKYYDINSLNDLLKIIDEENKNEESKEKPNNKEFTKNKCN